jgi:ferredoxin
MKLKIDNHEIETDEDLSILQAAAKVGIEIPVLCYKEGHEHFTSCMICVVKDVTSGRVLPACSARIADGMEIETQADSIRAFRKSTLELLLSEHVGDCEAPCQRLCAVHSEIPKMIREVRDKKLADAVFTVRSDVALASILERLCHAPCEKGCRRGQHDEPLAIQQMARHVADWHLKEENMFPLPCAPPTNKKVCIIGAGPSGLASAHYLAMKGHQCLVIDKSESIGGTLLETLEAEHIPAWVLDGEVSLLKSMGIEFRMSQKVDSDVFVLLQKEYDALILACGASAVEFLSSWNLKLAKKGIKTDKDTHQTSIEAVFAGGGTANAEMTMLKVVQNAKSLAACVSQCLTGVKISGEPDLYNHMMGRLQEGELELFVKHAAEGADKAIRDNRTSDINQEVAESESYRCLHCDCRANKNCSLREYSEEYGAKQNAFKINDRPPFVPTDRNKVAIYEPGKCMKCGICVRITQDGGEKYGFTFVGRGFEVKAGVSLDKNLEKGLGALANEAVEACPTGALSAQDGPNKNNS